MSNILESALITRNWDSLKNYIDDSALLSELPAHLQFIVDTIERAAGRENQELRDNVQIIEEIFKQAYDNLGAEGFGKEFSSVESAFNWVLPQVRPLLNNIASLYSIAFTFLSYSDSLAIALKNQLEKKEEVNPVENTGPYYEDVYPLGEEDYLKALEEFKNTGVPPDTQYLVMLKQRLDGLNDDQKEFFTMAYEDGWESAREENMVQASKKYIPDMAFLLKIKNDDSQYYPIYQQGYHDGQDFIARFTEKPISQDIVNMIMEEAEKSLAEKLLTLETDDERAAYTQGYREAISAELDSFYYGNI